MMKMEESMEVNHFPSMAYIMTEQKDVQLEMEAEIAVRVRVARVTSQIA